MKVPITRSTVVLRLAITFGVLWALSVAIWLPGFQDHPMGAIVLPPIAPIVVGLDLLMSEGNGWGMISLVISALAITATVFSIAKCRALGGAMASIILYIGLP